MGGKARKNGFVPPRFSALVPQGLVEMDSPVSVDLALPEPCIWSGYFPRVSAFCFCLGGWSKVRTEALPWKKGLVWRSPRSLSHTGYPSAEKGRPPPAPETQVFPRRPWLAGQKAGRVGLILLPLFPGCKLQKSSKSPFLLSFLFC